MATKIAKPTIALGTKPKKYVVLHFQYGSYDDAYMGTLASIQAEMEDSGHLDDFIEGDWEVYEISSAPQRLTLEKKLSLSIA